jgi:NAD(P)-dependent dehydrogenase (short-subunit alcohol dehydrogenase family)
MYTPHPVRHQSVPLSELTLELQKLNLEVRTVNVACDTANEEQVQKMVDEGVKAFGGVHYCVNNAGVTSKPRVRTHELSTEAWDRVQNVNLRGVWLCERAELRAMMKQEKELKMR